MGPGAERDLGVSNEKVRRDKMQQAQQAVCKLRTGSLVKVAATFGAPVHRDGDVMFLGSIIYSSEIQSI